MADSQQKTSEKSDRDNNRRRRDDRDDKMDRRDETRNRRSDRERRRDDRRDGKTRSRDDRDVRRRRDDDSKRGKIDDDLKEKTEQPPPKKKKMTEGEENLLTRTGGAYIPPAKLRMMQAQITDKSSAAYQRLSWETLKKSINGLINKVNMSNVGIIIRELIRENIIRGRGLLSRAILQAQAASPTFTHVYACFVAIINSKFPNIGELILKRLILQFRQGFRRNDKAICMSSTRFIAHLVNQEVAHELLALEILTLLLETPTDDAVEVAVGFLKECGMQLTNISPRGIHATFERLRSILHEGNLDKRVQYMIEVMFAIRKDKFVDHVSIPEELDLVPEADRYTHLVKLDDPVDAEQMLNVFKHDPSYEESEEKYKAIRKEILEEGSDDDDADGDGESDDEDDSDDEENEDSNKLIIDKTETNLVALRRTIYLTIQSSLDFEECAHKLLKMELKPGQEVELCHMILDCCAQQRTYEKFFGLLGQRFCQLNKMYITPFEQIFVDSYDTIHRLETNKLRNVAKFFSHLLYTDAINWMVLTHIRLNEQDTTSSSRIFIKILFQELSEYMGLPRLNDRLNDATLKEAFEGLFPRDNPRNTRFAINFFTSIGLGGLTDELREHLKSQPKVTNVPPQSAMAGSGGGVDDDAEEQTPSDSSEDEEESSSSSSSSDSDSSASESSESEPDVPVSRKKKRDSKSRKNSKTSGKKKAATSSREKSREKKEKRNRKSIQQEESPPPPPEVVKSPRQKRRRRSPEPEESPEVPSRRREMRDDDRFSRRDGGGGGRRGVVEKNKRNSASPVRNRERDQQYQARHRDREHRRR